MQPPSTRQYLADDPYGIPEFDGRAGWEVLDWNIAPTGEFVPHEAQAGIGGGSLTSQTLRVIPDVVVPPDPAGMAMGAYNGGTISVSPDVYNSVGMSYRYTGVGGTYEEANCFQSLFGIDPTWLWGYLDDLRNNRQESTQGAVLGWSTQLTDPNSAYRQQSQPMIEWLEDPDLAVLQWEADVPAGTGTFTLDGTDSALNPTPAPYTSAIHYLYGTRVIGSPGWSGAVESMTQLPRTVDFLGYHGSASWQDALDTRVGARGGFAWVVASSEQMFKTVPSPPSTVSMTEVAVAAYALRLRFRTPAYRLWTKKDGTVGPFPLRQKQRNDGLARGVFRARGTSSVQNSVRQRGYR